VFTSLVPPNPFESCQFFFLSKPSKKTARNLGGMSDRTLTCRDCGQAFTFTAGEQAFYAERGYSEPQRCPACRAARKAQRSSDGYDSGSSYGGGSYGGGGGYSRGGGGGYSSGPREMHAATCSNCGKQTEVPFQPTPGKPVYCRECFQEQRASRSGYGSRY
jgi:CxxC-x17-CxxC domain-containing protein